MKKRLLLLGIGFAILLFLASCAPAIVVQNNTTIPVRVVVVAGDMRGVLSPSPGEGSSIEVAEGAYRVAVIPDAEWIEYAKLSRKLLNERLANADQLTGPQLLEVIRQLKDVAERMQAYEKAAGTTGSCSGAITSEGGGLVQINMNADGALAAVCN